MSDNPAPAPTFATIESDDFNVSSNTETAEQLTENLKPEPAPEPVPADEGTDEGAEPSADDSAERLRAAASELGKAAAAKRREKAEEAPLGKPRDDPRARMLEATRKEAEAKREAAKERAERERLSAEIEQLRADRGAAPRDQPKPAEGKPKVEDFERYEDFVEALADHKANERLQAYRRESDVKAEQAERHQSITYAVETFIDRLEKAATTDTTFKERTVEVAQILQPSFTLGPGERIGPINVLADEVIRSKQGPALMLHLADHPEEIERFKALGSPTDVQVEARILAKSLSAAPQATAPRPEISRAKDPVRPVAGSPITASALDDNSSFDEHVQYMESREARRR